MRGVMNKANLDIRQYMADHGVTQKQLAEAVGASTYTISTKLSVELCQKDKEVYLNLIDSIVDDRNNVVDVNPIEEQTHTEQDPLIEDDASDITKFQIGDRVKIPSKANKIAIVKDIWSSTASKTIMYSVENEDDGYCGMYAENQLEPAPLPIDFSFGAHIDSNVAVVTMNAKQGNKTWVYARGHAHILHDGAVGMAQAVSYAARRMFEELDKRQENPVYFKR